MAAMYRDKVSVNGSAPIRANVHVVSASSIVRQGAAYDKRSIIVSIPPRQRIAIEVADTITWYGEDYTIQDAAIPIRALGRLDHWEIMAQKTVGA